MIKIFELRYSQNGGDAENGPVLGECWDKEYAERNCPSDCVVVPAMVTEAYAEANCQ